MGKTRDGFGKALADLGKKYPELVVLGCDITGSVKTSHFQKAFPERFFSMGIAEQDAAATAAGMARAGLIPVFATYGIFASGRAWEQVRTSIAYNNLHVIIGGAHGGISVGPDGATHQALEELAIMRAIPNMTVICPADENQTYAATVAAIEEAKGPVYIRFDRPDSPDFTEKKPFEIGKADILQKGTDLSIIATGSMIYRSLEACKILKEKGISARLISMPTIKPIDKEAIIAAAKETGLILTVEEHQTTAGLGSAVAEVVVQRTPVPMSFMGIEDRFGESGDPDEMFEYFKLTPKDIAKRAEELFRTK